MPDYPLQIASVWEGDLEEFEAAVAHLPEILDRVIDKVVLPILRAHYDASGIKTHSAILKDAITKRGAKGNLITHHGMGVTVGVDYAQAPYAQWVIEGRKRVVAKPRHALAFRIDGKLVIVKSVRAAPPHDIYSLTSSELESVQAGVLAEMQLFRKGGSG
jgi:hypothetical protein